MTERSDWKSTHLSQALPDGWDSPMISEKGFDRVTAKIEIPEGWKRWDGGDSAPDDWDGGMVMFRSGLRIHSSDQPVALAWWQTGSHGDIIAYKPKQEPVEETPFAYCEATLEVVLALIGKPASRCGGEQLEVGRLQKHIEIYAAICGLLPTKPDRIRDALKPYMANLDEVEEALNRVMKIVEEVRS